MTKPSPMAWLLASRPVFFGAWATILWLLYQWSVDPGIWPLILMAGFPIAAIMRADQQVSAYKAWKGDWDAMGGVTKVGTPGATRRVALSIAIIIAAIWVVQLPPHSQNAIAVLAFIAAMFGAAIWLLRRLFRRSKRRKAAQFPTVAICITRPIFAVPTLAQAYAALPDHCRRLG